MTREEIQAKIKEAEETISSWRGRLAQAQQVIGKAQEQILSLSGYIQAMREVNGEEEKVATPPEKPSRQQKRQAERKAGDVK